VGVAANYKVINLWARPGQGALAPLGNYPHARTRKVAWAAGNLAMRSYRALEDAHHLSAWGAWPIWPDLAREAMRTGLIQRTIEHRLADANEGPQLTVARLSKSLSIFERSLSAIMRGSIFRSISNS